MSKNEPCNMIFPKEKTFEYKNYFQEIALYFRIYCECRFDHNTEVKGENNENVYHQHPVYFTI